MNTGGWNKRAMDLVSTGGWGKRSAGNEEEKRAMDLVSSGESLECCVEHVRALSPMSNWITVVLRPKSDGENNSK